LGKSVRTPLDFTKPRAIPLKTIESALGQSLSGKEIQSALQAYGYEAKVSTGKVSVRLPSYRNDLMHVVDVVEDVAISRGYETFSPVMPSEFTVGSLSRIEQVSDRVRDLMIGFGFQEIISNILGAREEFCERMRVGGTEWAKPVEIENVMSQSYACLRPWITPSLLRVEAASTRSFYPHKLFEVGEVVVPDPSEEHGTQTRVVLGALVAHATASFAEIQSYVHLLLYYLDVPYALESSDHPSFLEGRGGAIVSNGQTIGLIGELHPEVLEQWQVTMPAVAFELELESLAAKA
jgi:phenylalanyl-tRNA synthetase beta chain